MKTGSSISSNSIYYHVDHLLLFVRICSIVYVVLFTSFLSRVSSYSIHMSNTCSFYC